MDLIKLAKDIGLFIQNGNWGILFLMFLLVILILIGKKISDTDLSKLTRWSKLREIKENKFKDELLNEYFSDRLENLAFYKETKIRANKERRTMIINAFNTLNQHGNQLSMMHFKRAYGFMKFDNNQLLIKIDVWSRILSISSMFFSFLMVFMSIALIIIHIFSDNKEQTMNVYLISMVFFIYGVVFLMFATPYISAKTVSRRLRKYKSENDD